MLTGFFLFVCLFLFALGNPGVSLGAQAQKVRLTEGKKPLGEVRDFSLLRQAQKELGIRQ